MGKKSSLTKKCKIALFLVFSFLSIQPILAAPGGFIEPTDATVARPLLTQSEIQNFLPSKGIFTFPSPYNTQAVRLTNGNDCSSQSDCIYSVGYSYWKNINNHVNSNIMYIFLGTKDKGPVLISYNKNTDEVQNLGPLFDASSRYASFSGEGWYFSATMPTKLYVPDFNKLFRYDVISRQFETVFDISAQYPDDNIWQAHSSDDDSVHSATLKDSSYQSLGCIVYKSSTQQFQFFARQGILDECNLDKSGRWLVMLDNIDGRNGEDNRIIDLSTGAETVLLDENGAAGHHDMGDGYMVAMDNWNNQANAVRVWNFNNNPLQGDLVYFSPSWDVTAPNHISHQNRVQGSSSQQYACGSSANPINDVRANEIECWLLDNSLQVLVAAPVMTDVNAAGGGSTVYDKLPKGNLDITGQYFIWTSNMGGSRQDAFLLKVPYQLLASGSSSPASTATTSTAATSILAQAATTSTVGGGGGGGGSGRSSSSSDSKSSTSVRSTSTVLSTSTNIIENIVIAKESEPESPGSQGKVFIIAFGVLLVAALSTIIPIVKLNKKPTIPFKLLKRYVTTALRQGYSKETIIEEALSKGWPRHMLDKLLKS